MHWWRKHRPLIQRFAERITPGENGCWNWTKALNHGGYPLFYVGGKPDHVKAHRWGWAHFVGPIPGGHEIDHRCGNPRCVRPGHCQTLTPEDHRKVTADRKKLRQIIGPDASLAPNVTHTELERAFGQAHGLPVTSDPALTVEGNPLLPATANSNQSIELN